MQLTKHLKLQYSNIISIFIKTIQTFVVSYKRAKWLFWRRGSAGHLKLLCEPDLSGLYPGPGNPCFQSQFFIGPRILPISSAKPTERVMYVHIYKSTINVRTKKNKTKSKKSRVHYANLDFSHIHFSYINVLSFLSFSGLTRHFTCLFFYFFIIHNGRLAVIFLFTDRQIRIRHIPQCNFLLSKEIISTSLKKQNTINAQLQK